MDVIVTHDTSDFDALAAMVAAQKLYPGAHMVRGRRLAPPVRDFLALHKDRFPTLKYNAVEHDAVSRLVVVDVRRRSRLRDYGPLLDRVAAGTLPVHLWDHHAAAEDDLVGEQEVVEPVGAVTTLLVEEMQRRGVAIDRAEATLFLVGIYTDTGCLTHAITTHRDLRAAAHLLEQGASLREVNRWIRPPFDDAQRAVLADVLEAVEGQKVGGAEVAFAHVAMDKAVDGLAEVTTEALALDSYAALFAIFHLGGKRVQVVARARAKWVDVGAALKHLGGGGHEGAGSAIVKGKQPAEVQAVILEALRADPPRPRRVLDVMSSPVQTVSPELRLEELDQTLAHSGAPVVRDGALVGIISRRDIERARRDGRLRLPVASCMAHGVRTTVPDASLEEALHEMIEADVGRLPVLRADRLVGIVSRTDVLRALYDDDGA